MVIFLPTALQAVTQQSSHNELDSVNMRSVKFS